MPVIEPGRPDLKELKGLHLWHGGLSNCSQRCRITLSELGLDYAGTIVNLQAAEHATEANRRNFPAADESSERDAKL